MSVEKKRGFNWLSLVALVWGLISPVCLFMAVFFVAFYDSPANPNAGLGLTDTLLIGAVFAFPIIAFLSSLGIWFLNHRDRSAAIMVALLPLIFLIPLIVVFTRPGSSLLKDSKNSVSATGCTTPIPDFGDGLTTTGCGSLERGLVASGKFSTTSEAHQWQVSVDGPVTFMIENDTVSCPHLIVLDDSGNVVESFEERNSLRLCPSGGLTSTGHYEFRPSAPGRYTLRVFSPDAPGEYWLRIE